jgi:hypothetical protein
VAEQTLTQQIDAARTITEVIAILQKSPLPVRFKYGVARQFALNMGLSLTADDFKRIGEKV